MKKWAGEPQSCENKCGWERKQPQLPTFKKIEKHRSVTCSQECCHLPASWCHQTIFISQATAWKTTETLKGVLFNVAVPVATIMNMGPDIKNEWEAHIVIVKKVQVDAVVVVPGRFRHLHRRIWNRLHSAICLSPFSCLRCLCPRQWVNKVNIYFLLKTRITTCDTNCHTMSTMRLFFSLAKQIYGALYHTFVLIPHAKPMKTSSLNIMLSLLYVGLLQIDRLSINRVERTYWNY